MAVDIKQSWGEYGPHHRLSGCWLLCKTSPDPSGLDQTFLNYRKKDQTVLKTKVFVKESTRGCGDSMRDDGMVHSNDRGERGDRHGRVTSSPPKPSQLHGQWSWINSSPQLSLLRQWLANSPRGAFGGGVSLVGLGQCPAELSQRRPHPDVPGQRVGQSDGSKR